jgi:hypothetical protein
VLTDQPVRIRSLVVTVRQKSDQTKKPAQPTAAKGSTTARVKAATYDGTSSWLDYKSHFDACSRINQWSENEKGLYLTVEEHNCHITVP